MLVELHRVAARRPLLFLIPKGWCLVPRKLTEFQEKQKAARERYDATMQPYREAVDQTRNLLDHHIRVMKMAQSRAAEAEQFLLRGAMAEDAKRYAKNRKNNR